jgi:predicted amidohydrolase YtcJ
MTCHKPPEAVLLALLKRKAAGHLDIGRKELINIEVEPDTSDLTEKPLDFDPKAPADLVVVNALMREREGLQTIAVTGNLVTRVGPHEQVRELISDKTRVVDAGGNAVLPGFTDSHLHLTVAMQKSRGADLEGVTDAAEMVRILADFARRNPDEPLLQAFGLHYFDPPLIPGSTARSVLDTVVADRPLVVYAHDLHTVWANTRALEEAGLLHPMPPFPPMLEELGLDAKIVLGQDGAPGGEIREPEVYYFLTGPLEEKYPLSLDQRLDALEAACSRLARLGFTCVHNMGLAQPAEEISFCLLLLELEQARRLPIRVNTSISAVADEHMLADVYQAYLVRNAIRRARAREHTAAELHEAIVALLAQTGQRRHGPEARPIPTEGPAGVVHRLHDSVLARHVAPHQERGNPHEKSEMPDHLNEHGKVRCDTVKIFMDGIVEKKTAYRLDQEPEEGIPEFSQAELDVLVPFADSLGMQVAAHCIGDGSVHAMLDAISAARDANRKLDKERGHRIPHRVEHIEMCQPGDVPRFGAEQAVASMQPLHQRAPTTLWHELVPREQWDTAFPWKDISTGGGLLVFGSDWPIVPCDVRMAVPHAVSRTPWFDGARDQSVSPQQALDAYTANAAKTDYSGAIKGTLAPGMLADLTILSGDAGALADPKAPQPDILLTICDGEITWDGRNQT